MSDTRPNVDIRLYSLPSINVNPWEWIKVNIYKVLTINNYKIIFLSNIQILTEMNVTGCVVFIMHIMVVFHSLTFIESNLQRRKYHFVNS
jgi:hypothetical protein